GRTCLKDTSVPTISSWSQGKEENPQGKRDVNMMEDTPEQTFGLQDVIHDDNNAYDYVREKFHLALPHPQTI
ncbi:Hypothetical protein SMAX5B_001095, partial [Scophthalmus maximus]